jgi:hypothetical protein
MTEQESKSIADSERSPASEAADAVETGPPGTEPEDEQRPEPPGTAEATNPEKPAVPPSRGTTH